jgi:hypothetical protein
VENRRVSERPTKRSKVPPTNSSKAIVGKKSAAGPPPVIEKKATSSTTVPRKAATGSVTHPLATLAAAASAKAKQASPQPAPRPSIVSLTKEQEESAQLLLKGVYHTLLENPACGEGESLTDLRKKLQMGFYSVFQLPMILCSGELVDPIELVQKGQSKCFSRLLEEPLTGAVSVLVLSENPVFPPVVSLTTGWELVPPVIRKTSPSPSPEIMALFSKLRELVHANLLVIDSALAKPPMDIPDLTLWKQALETLCGQQMQSRDILKGLI